MIGLFLGVSSCVTIVVIVKRIVTGRPIVAARVERYMRQVTYR